MRRIFPAAFLFAFIAACSGGDNVTAPDTALTIETSAVEFSSSVAALVSNVPSVTVKNSRGQGVSGVLVRWSVTSGGGRVVNDTIRTGSSGIASSGGWTLGPVAGTQTLQASVAGLAPVVFTATGVATTATRLVAVTSAITSAQVASAIGGAVSARAEDSYGNVVANVPVVFSVIAGGGSVEKSAATTDVRGVASAGQWNLGIVSGTQTVRATSASLSAADISITATPAEAFSINMVAGDNQSAASGSVVAQPPVVRVQDKYGNNVGNVPVVFTPGPSSGTVVGGSIQTDPATGTAVLGSWTLGAADAQTLLATSPILIGKSVTFHATVTNSQFDIDVRFVGDGGTPRQREAFTSAVTRWRRVITGDIGTARISSPAGECASWIPAINENVNDILIFVRLTSIDGPGKILGQASPCYVNSTSKLPIMGFFELDVDDLALLLNQGTLDNVVLHEMGHILGIGTLWSYQRSLLVGGGGTDPYFSGLNAIEQFGGLGGNLYSGLAVPVENSGGAGTRDAHWRRSVFANELMQGYAQAGGMPMSRVTIGSLADLGYQVTFNGADSFTFFPALRSLPAGEAVLLSDDIASTKLWEVQRDGSRKKVRN